MAKLGVSTDLELLEHLPVRYDPMTATPEIPMEAMSDGDRFRFRVEVTGVKTVQRAGLILFTAKGLYSGNVYNFSVYHQMFYLNRIAAGKQLFVTSVYSRKRLSVRGIFELDNRFVRAGIRPVYHLPKDVSQSTFERVISDVLASQSMRYIKDVIPKNLLDRYRLIPRAKAFACVHTPLNVKQLKLGLRVFQYEECLAYCVTSQANRKYLSLLKKNVRKQIDIKSLNSLVKSCGYTLTTDQVTAVKEIVSDMNSERGMFRLLEGDVSTGKTLVALFALFANYLRGGQGTLVAPTQALAQQHYQSARSILEPVGMKVGYLASGMKAKERREILDGIKNGSIDVLITTQAGAGEEVSYRDLSLVVIDEQQNFGVSQRAQLVAKGGAVDTLMMTATPIPRTILKLSSGDMELSELREFPKGIVRDVHTKVVSSNDPLMEKAINKALERNRQVFVVVPRIEESSISSDEMGSNVSAKEVYETYVSKYGKDRVQLLHGRMKSEDQERILSGFSSNECPILVSTSVIEVGMDIQKAGLMIVYSANLFGLSALHQLRGRIGRDGSFALCLLVYDGREKDTREKLEYVADNTDGFKIALYDAKTRGTGSLSGFNQSGGSDLAVADFVGNQAMLECASKDAVEVLDRMSSVSEYGEYVRAVIQEKTIRDALLS